MDELHQLSAILIERETIDKDQFERLLAGEAEEDGLPRRGAGGAAEPASAGAQAPPQPKPRPFPLPGATMQPPPPDTGQERGLCGVAGE